MNAFFITGTSRGLGNSLAVHLLKNPTNQVVGIARTCTIHHDRYRHITMDLSDTEAVVRFQFGLPGGIKRAVLINNAGVIAPIAPVGRIDNQALAAGFTINLVSPAILMNNFIRDTKTRNCERVIVNISSGAARHTVDSWAVYCAGKAGLDMFSQVLDSEQPIHHSKRPVRIFSIAPGVMDTGMQKQIRAIPKKDFAGKDRFVDMKKKGALVSADQAAETIIHIMEHPEKSPEVCLDVRNLS